MNTTLKMSMTAMGLVLASCNTPDTGVRLLGVIKPDLSGTGAAAVCKYEPNTVLFTATLDTFRSYQMTLGLAVQNTISSGDSFALGPTSRKFDVAPATRITPLRFELRWECDASGFRADIGPVVLPVFDPTQPFCLDQRSEVNKSFVGFDVVPASGASIDVGETGVAMIQPVPYQLGQAFDDLFEIARLADDCCRHTDSCDGTNMTSMTNSCASLTDIFNTLDPSGQQLSVKSAQPGSQSKDLARFRPFAVFHGDYYAQLEREHSAFGASYPMRLRGLLESQSADGSLTTSDELSFVVSFCKKCGTYAANQRQALGGSDCLFQ